MKKNIDSLKEEFYKKDIKEIPQFRRDEITRFVTENASTSLLKRMDDNTVIFDGACFNVVFTRNGKSVIASVFLYLTIFLDLDPLSPCNIIPILSFNGVANAHPKDVFDFEIGMRLALKRAFLTYWNPSMYYSMNFTDFYCGACGRAVDRMFRAALRRETVSKETRDAAKKRLFKALEPVKAPKKTPEKTQELTKNDSLTILTTRELVELSIKRLDTMFFFPTKGKDTIFLIKDLKEVKNLIESAICNEEDVLAMQRLLGK